MYQFTYLCIFLKLDSLISGNKLVEDHAKLYDDVPNSAVDLQVKDKVSDCTKPNATRSSSNNLPQFLRKLNRQERVVEEVKLVLKPHFNKKVITKEDYKDIMRRAVPKVSLIRGTVTYYHALLILF